MSPLTSWLFSGSCPACGTIHLMTVTTNGEFWDERALVRCKQHDCPQDVVLKLDRVIGEEGPG